jgi:hypothetical protein
MLNRCEVRNNSINSLSSNVLHLILPIKDDADRQALGV